MTTAPEPARPRIVDAHTHVFPPEMIRRREETCRLDAWFAALYSDPKAALAPIETLISSMNRAGVERSIICGFPWTDPAMCREHNDYMRHCARDAPDRLSWLGIVAPSGGSLAVREARRCFEGGASGIGELNSDAQGFAWDDQHLLAPLVDVCKAHDRPMMFHASEPVGHAYPGKGSATPAKILAFLQAFPGVRGVAAHWGGGLPFHELMPEVARAASRLVYDSAATTYLYRDDVFAAVVSIVGSERVLFASDYPVLGQERLLRRVRALPWVDARQETAVLGANAMRVYRIGDGREAAE